MMKELGPLLEFLDKPITAHKETHVPGKARDFLDVYLDEIKKTTDEASSFYGTVGGKIRFLSKSKFASRVYELFQKIFAVFFL